MELTTVQHINVIKVLKAEGIYRATFDNVAVNRIIPYKIMMMHYGWEYVPIFCSVPTAPLTRCDVTFNKRVILKLEIPDEDIGLLKYQSYYDWSDLIYYVESPGDIMPPSDINTIWENAFKPPREGQYWQATLPYLKSSWVIDSINPKFCSERKLGLFTEGKMSFADLKTRGRHKTTEVFL